MSDLRRICVELCRICVDVRRMCVDLCRMCVGIVSELCQMCVGLVSDLCRICVGFMSKSSKIEGLGFFKASLKGRRCLRRVEILKKHEKCHTPSVFADFR